MGVNGQARQQLLSRLQQHIAEQLGFTEVIDPNERLNDLGVDLLASVALSNSLEKEFGIPVSIAELISGPTINELVDGIFHELIGSFVTERNQIAETAPDAMPMGEELPERAPADAGPPASNGGTEVLNRTKIFGSSTFSREKVPPAASSMGVNGQARQQLLSSLQQHIAEQLGFTEVIDPNERLNDLGVDFASVGGFVEQP